MSDVTGNVSRMVKTCLPTLVCLACAGLMVGGKAATKMNGRPLVAHIGKGIGAYSARGRFLYTLAAGECRA